MKELPKVGERLVVHGMSHHTAVVEGVQWDRDRHGWRIDLNWGSYGKSRVWGHDEDHVWFRWSSNN